ncbi:AAA family ATPase [Dactylosporangium matsuzakiense]|uniref:Nuclease SbcCD subunit C n=1 Tax=Dactylosporangium matsuzakiense TaxID=53360 RepID=A0A9W6NQK7_9ACTN|nr:SMC family ATPase [Dactylosporangium matsuzakiense]UWZ44589.1 SMC family ATPase [Dactylosporangium matsuzakiense]GLL05351.1 nuclease SbcCD subunit C [Dactylosporangium matsuzakiense]
MKPLQLTFSGFRSYVGRQYIDFRGRDLVGIIGDTGAGKSTILMAINFALFGTPTWDAPSPKVLIADGGDGTLAAILEFEARGRPWRVTRQLSRKTTGTFHKLESLDGGEVVHGRSVTQRVIDLVGMDNKTFLRSVLLPQGKFEQLLHASDGERAKILKGLLGLDILDTIAVRARQHRDALTPAIADLRARRTAIGDPRTTARTAAEDAKTISVQLGQLKAAQTALAGLVDEEKAATEQHTALTKLRTTLAKAAQTDAPQRLRQLAALDREIADQERQLTARAEPLRTRREELLVELGDFRPGGSQAEALTTAVRQLSQLHERITNETQRCKRHQTDVHALEALRTETAEATAEATRHEPLLTQAEATLSDHTDVVDGLKDDLAKLRAALADARRLAEQREGLAATEQRLAAAASEKAADLEKKQEAATDLDREVDAADAELQAQRRANAAAHAGEGLAPGDACPVCEHVLPDGFTPPHALDLKAADRAVAAVQRKAKKAGEAAIEAVATHREARALADRATQDLTEQTTRTQAALDALTMQLGPFMLDSEDDVILAARLSALRQAAEEHAALAETAATLGKSKTEAAAKAKALGDQVDRDAAAAEREERELGKLHAGIVELIRQVPPGYRPDEPTTDAVLARQEAASRKQEELAGRWKSIDGIDDELKQLGALREELTQRRAEHVTKPAKTATQAVLKLRATQVAIAVMLSLPEAPDIDVTADVNVHSEWAAIVAAKALDATTSVDRQLIQLDQVRRRCAQQSAAIIAEAPTGGKPLEEALNDAIGRKAVADSTYQDATAKTVEYDNLIARLEIAQPHVDGLDALVKLLGDGKFVADVVHERQQTLLGTATELLRGMSLGRFLFGKDFQVWDEHTCRLRDVKTLSGGETFQASLALALALVEHASSNGGRAEALFLDEGFGTLDQTALAEALDALSTQANAGRLVVVISHMLAVAQHVTSLIRVTKSPIGSSLRWATEAELIALADAADAEGLHS